MTTALDLALSVSLASYARDLSTPATAVVSTQRLVKVERTKKGRTVQAKAGAPSPKAESPAAKPETPSPNGSKPGVALPAAGTLSAKGFVMMMNRVKSRDEAICAIAGFIGYDTRLSFGENEMAAKQAAKGALRPVSAEGPTRAEQREANRSAKGYVAGMPDALKRTVQDLLGREQLAVDTRQEHVRDARNHERPIAQRKLSIGLARLENERLVQIRADLARFI
jgi:hypothetical protein